MLTVFGTSGCASCAGSAMAVESFSRLSAESPNRTDCRSFLEAFSTATSIATAAADPMVGHIRKRNMLKQWWN